MKVMARLTVRQWSELTIFETDPFSNSSQAGGVGPVARIQLAQHALDVLVHRRRADPQVGGDLAVGPALSNAFQHLELPPAELGPRARIAPNRAVAGDALPAAGADHRLQLAEHVLDGQMLGQESNRAGIYGP